MGEGDDGASSNGAQLSAECSTSRASGGEASARDPRRGVDAEGFGVERSIVSMPL